MKTEIYQERAVLVGLITPEQDAGKAKSIWMSLLFLLILQC